MNVLYFSLQSAALIGTSAANPHRCAAKNAVYASPISGMSLSFIDIGRRRGIISDLAVRILERRTHHEFWYYFDQGSAPKISLISTTGVTGPTWSPGPNGGKPPYGTATFIGLRKSGEILFDAPSSKSAAPDYVIIPELAGVFKTMRLWDVDANAFVLIGCSKSRAAG